MRCLSDVSLEHVIETLYSRQLCERKNQWSVLNWRVVMYINEVFKDGHRCLVKYECPDLKDSTVYL